VAYGTGLAGWIQNTVRRDEAEEEWLGSHDRSTSAMMPLCDGGEAIVTSD
jgi:hypothetical protein